MVATCENDGDEASVVSYGLTPACMQNSPGGPASATLGYDMLSQFNDVVV